MQRRLFFIYAILFATFPLSAQEKTHNETKNLGATINEKVTESLAKAQKSWRDALWFHFEEIASVDRLTPQQVAEIDPNPQYTRIGLVGANFLGSDVNPKRPYKTFRSCTAYALDNHWLILPRKGCLQEDSNLVFDEDNNQYYQYSEKTIISDFHFLGHSLYSISPKNYAINKNLMLVWTGDVFAVNFLRSLQKVNLLAVSTPEHLRYLGQGNPILLAEYNDATLKAKAYSRPFPKESNLLNPAHKNNLGATALWNEKVLQQKLNYNTFQFNDADIDDKAGLTLFLRTPSGFEFLVGYSNSIKGFSLSRKKDDSLSIFSHTYPQGYFTLALEDLEFIKKTVLEKRPKDWERIKNRLFFDQTETPYFK